MTNEINKLKALITQLEEQLANSEKRFKNVISRIADAILIVDKNGIVKFANPAASNLFDRQEIELIGYPLGFPIFAGEKSEIDIIKRNGENAIAELRVVETEWEGSDVYLASMRDITDRKKTEEMLLETTSELNAIFQAFPDMYFRFGQEGTILDYHADSGSQLSEKEIIGKRINDIFPEDISFLFFEAIQQVVNGKPIISIEYCLDENYDSIYYEARIIEFRNKEAIAIIRNITERKKAEIALKNAREHEVQIASNIQNQLLLGKPPQNIYGIEIAALTEPSQEIDGDFYDFFEINSNSFDLIVGDVMGKGIPAALIGAGVKSLFLRGINHLISPFTLGRVPEPEEIVTYVNSSVCDQLTNLESFLTACYTRFELNNRIVKLVDCGHAKTILCKDNGTCIMLHGSNMPLGAYEKEEYRQIIIPFEKNDQFFFYSDGLTEARNLKGEMFGENRLVQVLKKSHDAQPNELINIIRNLVIEFTETEVLSDDLSCVIVKIFD